MIKISHHISHWYVFQNHAIEITATFPKNQWVKATIQQTISKWFSVCDTYLQSKIGLYLLNNCNGSFLIISLEWETSISELVPIVDTLWSLSWVKSSQLHLYNTENDLDATGDWVLSLTAVSQQDEDAKAKSRSMNLQASWFHQTLINPKLSNPLEMATAVKQCFDITLTGKIAFYIENKGVSSVNIANGVSNDELQFCIISVRLALDWPVIILCEVQRMDT